MKKIVGILLMILTAAPAAAGAATLHFLATSTPLHVGDTFTVDVALDTGADNVNALGGSIDFSPNLTLVSVRYLGSLIPLWLTTPALTAPNTISFAGVIPGGYQGASTHLSQEGNVCTLVFAAHSAGAARVAFGSDTAAYENDGTGALAPLSTPALTLSILPASGSAQIVAFPPDTTPPEPFTPTIVPGASFATTGSMLVFATQDKNSGISHYEIAASYDATPPSDASWQSVESPYPIPADDADKFIFVRALDNAGNARVETVPPQIVSASAILHRFALAIILFTALLVILFLRLFFRLRKK